MEVEMEGDGIEDFIDNSLPVFDDEGNIDINSPGFIEAAQFAMLQILPIVFGDDLVTEEISSLVTD